MDYKKGAFTTVPNLDILEGKNPILQCLYMWVCNYSNGEGECFPSIKTLAKKTGCSINSITKFLVELEKLGCLKKTSRKDGNVNLSNIYKICIVGTPRGGGVPQEVGEGSPRGGGGFPKRWVLTKPIELKPINNKKINKEEQFEIFYKAFPKKKSKKEAQKVFNKVIKNISLEVLLKALEQEKHEKEQLKATDAFCPEWKHPATWLNQGCWEDEVNLQYEPGSKEEYNAMREATGSNNAFTEKYGEELSEQFYYSKK